MAYNQDKHFPIPRLERTRNVRHDTRHEIRTETVTLPVSDGTTMPAYVARPEAGGPHPGLLVFQEAFGVNAHIRDVTERFAREGYTAIAPALFHRTDPHFEGSYTDFGAVMPHMQALTDDGQSADIQAAYDWLTAEDGGQAPAVGSIGYCMGGRTSFLADTLLPAPRLRLLLRRRHRAQPQPELPRPAGAGRRPARPAPALLGRQGRAHRPGPSTRRGGRPAGGGQALRAGDVLRGRPRLLLRRPRQLQPGSPPARPGR